MKSIKALDSLWWQAFKRKSSSLKQPFLLKSVFGGEFDVLIHDFFIKLQCDRVLVEAAAPHVRVFVNDGQRKDLSLKLLTFKILPNESLLDWCGRFFKGDKFSVVFNDFGSFDQEVTEEFANYFSHFLKQLGVPRFLHLTFFIGNYSYTPFGVHIDHPGLKAIHFHIGPGRKKMLLWTPNSLVGLNPRLIEYMDVNELIPRSTSQFIIEAGDIFYFPVDKYYHIGSNLDEFSIALSLGWNNSTIADLAHKTVEKLTNEQLVTNDFVPIKSLKAHQSYVGSLARIKSILTSLNKTLDNNTFDFIADNLQSRLSNFGFTPFEFSLSTPLISINTMVILVKPFKILTSKQEKSLKVFARGKKMTVPYDRRLIKLIALINSGESIVVGVAGRNLIASYGETKILTFFDFLAKTAVIRSI